MKVENEIQNDLKELVKARLGVLSPDIGISIGSNGTYTRDELIKHVEAGDDIGRKITQIEMEFLQAMKKGEFYV